MFGVTHPDPRVGSGKLWDDLGSAQFLTNSGGVETRPPTTRNSFRGKSIGSSDDGDDDELDFLSSGSRSEDVEDTSQTSPRKSKRGPIKRQPRKAISQEQELDCHPRYPPKVKLPNFKKLTVPKEGGVSTPRNKPSDVSRDIPKQTKSYSSHPGISGTSSDDGVFFGGGAHSSDRVRSRRQIQLSDSSDCNQPTPRAKRRSKFPTLDPLSISDSTGYKQASRKAVEKGKVRLKGSSDSVTPFVQSETTADRITPQKHSASSRFPFLSPLSSPVYRHPHSSLSTVQRTKSPDTSNAESDEDANKQTPKQRPPLRPFPMTATSQLNNTIRTPCPIITSTQQAHLSNGGDIISGDLEEFGDDSLIIGELADPSMLCPFCDERLPPNPSPLYRSLLEAAKRKAYPDPRPSNPRGLKASMGIYVASCKRHRFEAHQIPEALAKGWPMDIDFGRVRDRVEQLRDSLRKLVKGKGNARDENIYWTTVMMEVQKMGSRAASGVKGQFESFQRTQPGYYGELGSMILHQTLYNMFPPSSFDAQSIAPLTPQEFIQRILVPEAALALIMEDTGQDRIQAVQTMRESAGYGMAMFPDTSEGPGIGAGEDIVLERARARRRQLDDEERMEAVLHSLGSEDEQSTKNKGTKRPKKLHSATTTDIEGTSAVQHKMKKKKAGSRTDAESEADDHKCEVTAVHNNIRGPTSALKPNISHLTQTNMDSQAYRLKARPTHSGAYSHLKRASVNAGIEPNVSPVVQNSLGIPDGRSINAPIDVDAQIIHIVDTSSQSEGEPRIPAKTLRKGLRSSRAVSGSSDAEAQEVGHDNPTPKPKPRRQLPRLEPNNPLLLLPARDPGRESSVEIIEPPRNSNRLACPPTTSGAPSGDFTNTRIGHPHSYHKTHDWLINDSSD